VAGCNLIFAPDAWLLLDNLNVLSPDGFSHSFDNRAKGYARGEGFGVVIIKRLSDALRNGDTIRAVIRSSGTNQNGHMASGITRTNQEAQEALMTETYRKASLDMGLTRFVEAHGTGTKLGDAVEANAIGRAFRKNRNPNDFVYV
jgi:acyl transferase domain-containing protein